MADDYDIAVDFMDMTNDRHLWARAADARPGLELAVGRHVVVGDEDADPKVARIVGRRRRREHRARGPPGQRRVPRRPAGAGLNPVACFYGFFYLTRNDTAA